MNPIISSESKTASQSRWGWHPVNREYFQKLKQLKKWYWEAVYAVGRWRRWERKTVHRAATAPKYYPGFVENGPTYKTVTHRGMDGEVIGYGSKRLPLTLNDHGVLAAFDAARMPAATPEQVVPLGLSLEMIDRLYHEAEEWYNKK